MSKNNGSKPITFKSNIPIIKGRPELETYFDKMYKCPCCDSKELLLNKSWDAVKEADIQYNNNALNISFNDWCTNCGNNYAVRIIRRRVKKVEAPE